MIIENPENYRFVRFQVSDTKGKKYDAILQDLETKKNDVFLLVIESMDIMKIVL